VAISPASSAGGRASFSALWGEVRTEVSDFIQHGSSDGAAPSLNVEGWMLRQRLQGSVGLDGLDGPDGAASTPAQHAFLRKIGPWAEQTAERLGVEPHLVAAHAALESGWGQKPLRQADGSDTHNLFSVKATGRWSGDSATVTTTEFNDGIAQRQNERFRSYPDYASAFQDYARLLTESPRYQGALNVGDDAHAFAQGLARGGYATDPVYADKLARVAAQVKAASQLASGTLASAPQRRD